MHYRYHVATAASFLAVLVTGGVWIGVAHRMGAQPGVAIPLLGVAFSAAFVSLLIMRLRSLLAHPERRLLELALLALNLGILILTFAWIHSEVGLMDVSGPAPRPTHDLGAAIYFSIVTSTTLGYGDFIPLGPGRPVAAIQAVTGYLILGILVSSGFQIIAPHTSPGERAGEKSRGSSEAARAE